MRHFLSVLSFAVSIGSAASIAQTGDNDIGAALQRLEGTLSAQALPQFSGGKLTSCVVEFNAIVRDWTSRSGAYSKVAGSFGFMKMDGVIGPTLKVIVHDIDPNTFALKPSPPKSAYVANGLANNSSSVIGAFPSDTPGAVFVVFKLEPTSGYYVEALTNGRIKLFFTRTSKGSDIPVDINLRVQETDNNGVRTFSETTTIEIFDCFKTLFSDAK